MKVIVLASQKGGVGKSTLTGNLAVAADLAGDGPAVLIDTDPQGSLSAWWNARQSGRRLGRV
jgi:chromosome partitioning protein